MRYSIEPRDRIYVKSYGFLSFAKNMSKSLSNKYGQNLFDSPKISMTDAINTASKRPIQRTAEATGDLTGNKSADKITSVSKKKTAKELHNNDETEENLEITTHKKRYIAHIERLQIIDELKLVPRNYWQTNANAKKYKFTVSIIMEYQKIANLLDNETNQPSKFRTRNWVEINDESREAYTGNDIKFKTTMLRFNLCDDADAYILLKGTISFTGARNDRAAKPLDERDKGVTFKNCGPFTKCLRRINNTDIDTARDIDIVMLCITWLNIAIII